ncbi:hypothetical protein [Escherichia phage vB_EcoM-E33]|uniref:Uncharacterized protein n=8 Tax=Caudoviricetes TaxID=2731619 RepID=A0A172Q1U8_9CAUD|nr:hypothetical protein F392_gp169 [Escherichia phage Bp7]YP_009202795.1 hypothetical protein AVT32_gp064 [Escherichia phage QL01]YP_009323264.1 hypothetical protein BOW89_gp065 [Escherichia phage WG01]YP_009323959.1 hypothetical protein BOW90_gp062 [Escherichia phage MX01]YP_010094891.1 hypothetical protein KNT86_gp217 [Enterobacteria phage vB_EcoM_IME341]YP_010100210.1 hypothetical protein KNU29_gp007 [Escherichia phage AnYang]YP_010100604.1 hypothetical protein KNU35_gp180 [Escherichia pha
MEHQINITPLLDGMEDFEALPYFIKLILRDVKGLPIDIDPLNVRNIEFTSPDNNVDYRYHVENANFYFTIELTPKD